MKACPDDETLHDLLLGELPAASAEVLRAHVTVCDSCLATLDRLSDDPVLAEWMAVGLGAGEDRPADRVEIESGRREPRVLGPYEIESEIGRGGMGVVYLARERTLGRLVALKVLRPDLDGARGRQRFVREVRAAAVIDHEHVVRVYATSDPSEPLLYFAMEYVDGPSLAGRIRSEGRIDPREAADLVAQAAGGLAAAHEAGLVHRDVKPDNILIEAATGRVRVGDFGLARIAAEASGLTQSGVIAGTPAYLSPEQARGDADVGPLADVYGLGVTLYECLAGEPPFRGTTHMVVQQVIHDEPRPPRAYSEDIPRDLDTICLKAMAKEPSKRYQTTKAFSEDLRRFLRGEPILARPVGTFEGLWRWYLNNRRVAALSVLAVLLLLTLATGSTVAAIWISRERSKAIEQARIAEIQRGLTLDALNSLIEKVQDQLATRPGTLELRRSLLEVARDGLGKVIREVPGQARAEIDGRTVAAMIKLGDIDVILGHAAEARAGFDRAARLAERYSSENPDSLALRRNLAAAFDRLGDIDKSHYQGKDEDEPYRRSYAIRLGLIAEHPENSVIRRDLRVSQSKLADVYSASGDVGKAREFLFAYLNALLQEPDNDDDGLIRLTDKRFIYGRIGRLQQRLGRRSEAIASIGEALAAAEALCKLDPENAESRRQKSITLDYLGLACLKFGDLEGAEKALTDFKDDRASAFRADPTNRDAQRSLALSHQHLGDLAMRRDDFHLATKQYLEASKIFEEIAIHDPSSAAAHKDRLIVLRQLTDMEVRRNRFGEAVRWLDRQLEIQAGKDVPPHSDQAGWISEAKFVRDVYLLVPLALRDPRSVGARPQNVENLLLKTRALALARAGRVDEAAEAARELLSIPDSLGEALTAARTYAIIVKSLAKTNPEERTFYMKASVQALSRAIDHEPSRASHIEFDEFFECIRHEPGFRSLLSRAPL